MSTKKIDAGVYIPVLKELVEEGRDVSLTISGNSMAPFLKDGRDIIVISPVKQRLKKGDMVFYQRKSGQFVMHRIHHVKQNGYYLVGDAQDYIEGPVLREQIFGVVTSVRRKNKWIKPGSLSWKFYSKVWIRLVPVRLVIFKIYGATVGRGRK